MSNQEYEDPNTDPERRGSPMSISSGELLDIPMEDSSEVFDYFDPSSLSPIISAVLEGDLIRLQNLVTQGKSLRVVDNKGNTLLHHAVLTSTPENLDILQYLLTLEDIDLNAADYDGKTPLFICTNNLKEREALLLVEAGADVNLGTKEGVTPLHVAVTLSTTLAEKLILRGATIDCVDGQGDTPLHYAVAVGILETVAMLLYYNADANVVNSDGMTPFMESLMINSELSDELFEYVTDFNEADSKGFSTLVLALSYDYSRVVEIIERGADVNYSGNREGGCILFLLGSVPMELDTFQCIWERFDYKKGLGRKLPHILIAILNYTHFTDDYKLQAVKIILCCENKTKLLHLTKESDIYPIIMPLTYRLYKLGVSSEDCLKYCLILLSFGLKVYDVDLDMVYECFGFCDLFEMLLLMDIEASSVKKFNFLPYIIYQVGETFESLRMELDHRFSISYNHSLDHIDYENVLEHISAFDVMSWFEIEDIDPICRRLREYILNFPRVPKLQELAIWKAREIVRIKYNTENSCQFYTVLKHCQIAPFTRSLISFDFPLYRNHNTADTQLWKQWIKRKREKHITALDDSYFNDIPFPYRFGRTLRAGNNLN